MGKNFFKSATLSSVLFFLLYANISHGQPISSGERIKKGVAYYDNGAYAKAIDEYLQVHEGDTNYTDAIYEATLAYTADSMFEKARDTGLKGLKSPYSNKRDFMVLLGNIYDYLGKKDSAIYYYDQVIAQNLTDNQPLYEKGVIYFQEKDYDKATSFFQASLIVNPYHYRSHLLLGTCYLMQGRMTEGYIALLSSLLMTNQIEQARSAISMLDETTKQTDDIVKAYRSRDSKYSHDLYDETDQLINARLALRKEYKVNSDLDEDNVIRVAYMIMEKIKYDKEDDNFVMQYYIPSMQQIFREGKFDPYIFLLFSGYNIEAIEKKVKRQKSDMKEIRELVFPYFAKIQQTQVLNFEERKKASVKYYADGEENMCLVANFVTFNPLKIKEGPAKLYSSNVLVAEGNYNAYGKKDGKWLYYYQFGGKRLEETYNNGELTGVSTRYYRNGLPMVQQQYNSKGEVINKKEYRYNGAYHKEIVYGKDGTEDETNYYLSGKKLSETKSKNGDFADGIQRVYFENGTVQRELTVQNGKINGAYKQFYENGKPSDETLYKEGKRSGVAKTFYENGNLWQTMNYEDDKLEGENIVYDEHGNIIVKRNYKNDKKEGEEHVYEEGKEIGVITYRNGKPTGYKYVDLDGNILGEDNSRDLKLIRTFYGNGNLKRELALKNGVITGTDKNYFETGEQKDLNNYVDGVMDGPSTGYYKNGAVSVRSTYKDNQLNGEYKGYYLNGNLKSEGWLIDGGKDGLWKFYYNNGKIQSEEFTQDEELNGPLNSYSINGALEYQDIYDEGMLIGVIQYDTNGKQYFSEQYPGGNGHYRMVYPDLKTTLFECDLKYGEYNGRYLKHFPDGSLMEAGNFYFGKKEGEYTSYYINGKVQVKGMFKNGDKEGTWSYYNEQGVIDRETNYYQDKETGAEKIYDNGNLSYQYNYDDGVMDGDQFVYGEDRKLAAILKYKQGVLVGYTYEGKDEQQVPVIKIKNGKGRVETFYPNGNKAVLFTYDHNAKDGVQYRYYSNGQLAEQKEFGNMMLQGVHKKYYPDGTLMYEASYKDGDYDKDSRRYDPSGKLVVQYSYYDDYFHGKASIPNPADNKSIEMIYRYGHLLSIKR